MKVAHLTTVDLSLWFLLRAQLLGIRDEGYEVVGISAPGPWVASLRREGIRHVALTSSTRSLDLGADLRSALELWRVLRREQFDVLHTHTPKPGLYGRVVGRLTGVPIVVNTVHGLYATTDDHWSRRLGVYALEALAARFSDAELVQNPEDLAFMHRARITRRARLLGNGVDLARFDPSRYSAADRLAVRDGLGVGSDQIVVGSVGRLVAEKGYPELFAAVAGLDPSLYVLVAVGGEDPQKRDALDPALVAKARARGARILGHRDDVDALYAAMDVFVLASHREGYPRAAMEAAAMGLPIVATDIRGAREVVDPGRTGVLVPPRDVAALTAAIACLGEDKARRIAFGRAGRELASARFDERRVVRTVLETYRDTALRKGVTRSPVDVLQVVVSDDRRGPETHALDLAGALRSCGRRVRTVALAPGSHGGGLAVTPLGARPLSIGTLRQLRRAARSAGVVVAHGSTTLPACALALAGTGVPLVYRSIGDPERWSATRGRRARVRLLLRRASAVVALTESSACTLRSRYGVPRGRVAVIPIAVHHERHEPVDAAAKRAARADLGLPAEGDVAAIVGALSPEKNVALAIDAVASLPSIHLLVVGDGPDRPMLEARAAQRAAGRVHFTGSMADPGPAYAAADLVVLTSSTEGLPAVLIEAGLRELPVVATDVGYVREIVADGETGILVPPGDAFAVVSAIARALAQRAVLGPAARQRCLDRFDVAPVARKWDRLLAPLFATGAS